MKEVDLAKYKYWGADIVKDIIKNNKANYSNAKRNFIWADITSSTLPQVDLLFCRDCLVHFSYNDIARAVSNMKRSKSKYLLTTTFLTCKNRDIESR